MRERKGTEFINAQKLKSGTKEKKAPRARNRTVMLDASETAKVRAKFKNQDTPDESADDGFLSPSQLGKKQIEEKKVASDDSVFIEEDGDILSNEDVFVEPSKVNADEINEKIILSDDGLDEEISLGSEKSESIFLSETEEDKEVSYLEEPTVFNEEKEVPREAINNSVNKQVESCESQVMKVDNKVHVVYSNSEELLGFLIFKAEGSDKYSKYIELRKSRLILTSIAPKGGEYIFIDDESVSPMHAVLRISDSNTIQILDQLSENGTKIIKKESGETLELLGDKSTLENGDVVFFGDFEFKVCLIS